MPWNGCCLLTQCSYENVRDTSCAVAPKKYPLKPSHLCKFLEIVPPILSIEQEKTNTREMKISTFLLIHFLQIIIVASKLIVRNCYRKTNYCVYYLDEFWFSDGSLSDKAKFNDPGLMPLPDTATGLDWSHLVDAARAFEGNRKI